MAKLKAFKRTFDFTILKIILEFFDIVYSAILSFAILFGAYIYANLFIVEDMRKFFVMGLGIKILGAISFLLVYIYYFNRLGDTFAYLGYSAKLYELILSKPSVFFEIFTPNATGKSIEFYGYIKYIDFYADWDTYTVILFATFTSFFALGLPLANTILFSALSFLGNWLLFVTFCKFSLKQKIISAISALFIPSVMFWGSGVLKDTLVVGFMGVFIYSFFLIMNTKKNKVIWLIIAITSLFIISLVKPYVTVSLLFGLIIWLTIANLQRFKNPVLKLIILPAVILLSFLFIGYFAIKIGDIFPQYSTEKVLVTASSYQKHHYADGDVTKSGSGSGYSLGAYDPTLSGALIKILPAINVSLFRPYLWEVRNPMMLLSSLESSSMLFLFLFIIFKVGPINFLGIIRSSAFLSFCLSFSVFFAFAVGFTSYNFGALARYKIPLMPFFLFSLLYVFQVIKTRKKKAFFLRGN